MTQERIHNIGQTGSRETHQPSTTERRSTTADQKRTAAQLQQSHQRNRQNITTRTNTAPSTTTVPTQTTETKGTYDTEKEEEKNTRATQKPRGLHGNPPNPNHVPSPSTPIALKRVRGRPLSHGPPTCLSTYEPHYDSRHKFLQRKSEPGLAPSFRRVTYTYSYFACNSTPLSKKSCPSKARATRHAQTERQRASVRTTHYSLRALSCSSNHTHTAFFPILPGAVNSVQRNAFPHMRELNLELPPPLQVVFLPNDR